MKKIRAIFFHTISPLFLLVVGIFSGCDMVDEYKAELDSIPEISNAPGQLYKPAYGKDDTLTIVGRLHPEKDPVVMVGGINAPIVKSGEKSGLDFLSVIITEEMGIGTGRPVSVKVGDKVAIGASIEIYGLGEDGTFTRSLKLVSHAESEGNQQNLYMHCINGKGDIFYINALNKSFYKVTSDGNTTLLLSGTEMQQDENGSFSISTLIAGGVNPEGTKAWLSFQQRDGYSRFCEIDIQAKTVKTLNLSLKIEAPYEGKISDLNTIFCGIYPDDKGSIYLRVGFQPQQTLITAIAKYNTQDGTLKYLFKGIAGSDMPGKVLDKNGKIRIYPQEASLYILATHSIDDRGYPIDATGITHYNLDNQLNLNSFIPFDIRRDDFYRFAGPFLDTKIVLSAEDAGMSFGFLPRPGQKVQFLLYQSPYWYGEVPASEYPKWLISDFKNEKVSVFAPGNCDMDGFKLLPIGTGTRIDELLNYDEEGHLFMTANGRTELIKTAINTENSEE